MSGGGHDLLDDGLGDDGDVLAGGGSLESLEEDVVTAKIGRFRKILSCGCWVHVKGWINYPIWRCSVSFEGDPDEELIVEVDRELLEIETNSGDVYSGQTNDVDY
ncbi:hypothetical protein Tsubulata_048620 [Turnera subulata]|uniref:Uncharacterized protein n=1 Tax=Turnera subulata TaxID=218843 RepID=A0A9Q0GCN3_9ROSI|nr:hypothetical protein Tsubulata_048620 [Turnera subulata]